jgi:hypothetical protein
MDSVFVAADSRVGIRGSKRYDTACKIFKTGKIYYTFAGSTFPGESPATFVKYFDNTKDLRHVASDFLFNRYSKLLKELTSYQNVDSAGYDNNFEKYMTADAVFWGIEKDTIKMMHTAFKIISKPNEQPVIDTVSATLPFVSPYSMHALGHFDAISTAYGNPEIWRDG